MLAYGASASAEVPIVAGTLLVVAGVVMLHRLLIDLVAPLANRAPLTLRFAARDASRQASRTGPAVIASILALDARRVGAIWSTTASGSTDTTAAADAPDGSAHHPHPFPADHETAGHQRG